MATYSNLGMGSSGSSVRKLQNALINKGYSVGNSGADGVFGNDTLRAVKKYQKANGLSVDGIAGQNTLTKLYGSGKTTTTGKTPAKTSSGTKSKQTTTKVNVSGVSTSTQKAINKQYQPGAEVQADKKKMQANQTYKESTQVKAARDYLNKVNKQKPGEYKSAWEQDMKDLYDKIMNREKFTYDLSQDQLYQQYKDQYTNLGQQAMADTMGQAAGLTGGYGSSYGQAVGQQQYNAYLQQLNDKVPELYQQAYQQYRNEGEDLYNQYGLAAERDETDYGRYRDKVGDWQVERDYAKGRYDTERDFDYGKFADNRDYYTGIYQTDRNFDYGKYSDAIDRAVQVAGMENSDYWNRQDEKFQREQFAYQQKQDELARADALAAAVAGGSSSGSSGGSSGRSSSGGSSGRYSSSAAAKQQQLVDAGYDIAVDGVWGPQSQAAWDKYKNEDSDGYSTVDQELKNAHGNDVYNAKAITEAYQAGIITKSERDKLQKKYAASIELMK
ncbi:MAG: peptidoglycan-binding protein [Clostridiales bacterium]|nr:peptidoglycan-binding protein [Candidatus Cacconaster stercorequi]